MSTVHLTPCYLCEETIVLVEGDLREALVAVWNDAEAILLAHAFDGLIWGRIKGGRVELASDPPRSIEALS